MLCGLAAIVFATLAAVSHYALACYVAGFMLSFLLFNPLQLPNAITIGLLIAFAGFLQLTKPRYFVLVSTCGGFLAGLWFSVMQLQGLTQFTASLISIIVPAITILLAQRRHHFVPLSISEESLSITIILGLGLAAIPDIISGWQSAMILNRGTGNIESSDISLWIILVVFASAFGGGLYTFWKQR